MSSFVPLPLNFEPGVVKDRTRRANEMGWWDADKVRFVGGLPQTIGGWSRPFTDTTIGTPRAMFSWADLDGQRLMGIGTNIKYYIEEGGELTDITPLRDTESLGANPIATTNLSSIITVTDASHGAQVGDYVTLAGATTTNGVADTAINVEHIILTVPSANTYTVDTGDAASSTGSGGGAGVTAEYQINVGLDSAVGGTGFGAGPYSRGTWSSAYALATVTEQLRVWSNDNWGEDLVINVRGSGIYYYDRSSPGRAEEIGTLGGASDTPVLADQILVATDQRYLLAFGCNELGGSTHDPMIWRWADQESVVDWTPGPDNTAGGNRLTVGSQFLRAVKTREEIAAFTDAALFSIQYVPDPAVVFSQKLVSPNVKLAGPNAAGFAGGAVYWMESRGFKKYDGRVQKLPCGLEDYVFRDLNLAQLWKVVCAPNAIYNEIWWFYPSASSDEIDRYVILDLGTGVWTPGTMERTAWLDNTLFDFPRAADTSGQIYDHEVGFNDGSVSPDVPLEPFVESSPFKIADGSRAMFIRSIWPDLNFLDSVSGAATATLVLKLQNRAGSTLLGSKSSDVTRTVTAPIEVFTDRVDIGKRAHLAALRIESAAVDTAWRLGQPHMEVKPDGRRG